MCLDCLRDVNIVVAAQMAQDAQVGYSCDYQNKRNPVGIHEAKEWMKGHKQLHENLRGESIPYQGRRTAQRIMSDSYGKGIVRGAVECVSLLTYGNVGDVTAAETIKTSRSRTFYGGAFLGRVERAVGLENACISRIYGEVDARNPLDKKIAIKNVDIMYGCRGNDPRIFHLSP